MVTTDPITLFSIDPTHRLYTLMDLYEYFPLIGPVPPKLSITSVDTNQRLLCLHNPQDNTVLLIDLKERTASSISVPQFSNFKTSVMIKELAKQGILSEFLFTLFLFRDFC